jgi:5-methylcytosine-specific restriction endonuclease McrA
MGKQWNSNEDALQMAKQNFERSEKYRLALEVVTAERDALKAQLADAAKVSDGVWEWVPKPKYDVLKDKIEKARKLADEADCMDCSLGLHIRDVLDDVLPLQHVTEQE